jgi:hypothetical protein
MAGSSEVGPVQLAYFIAVGRQNDQKEKRDDNQDDW